MVSRKEIVSTVHPTLINVHSEGDYYSAEFYMTLTWKMTPVTQVIVYQSVQTSTSRREIVADSLALNIQGLLQNEVIFFLIEYVL